MYRNFWTKGHVNFKLDRGLDSVADWVQFVSILKPTVRVSQSTYHLYVLSGI